MGPPGCMSKSSGVIHSHLIPELGFSGQSTRNLMHTLIGM